MPYFQSLKLIHKFIFLSPTRSPKLRGVITGNARSKRTQCQGRRSCQGWTSAAATSPLPHPWRTLLMRHFLSFPLAGVAHTQEQMTTSPFPARAIIRDKITQLTSACQGPLVLARRIPPQTHLLPLLSSADLSSNIEFLKNSREMQICDLKIQPQSHHSPPSSYPAPSPKED